MVSFLYPRQDIDGVWRQGIDNTPLTIVVLPDIIK